MTSLRSDMRWLKRERLRYSFTSGTESSSESSITTSTIVSWLIVQGECYGGKTVVNFDNIKPPSPCQQVYCLNISSVQLVFYLFIYLFLPRILHMTNDSLDLINLEIVLTIMDIGNWSESLAKIEYIMHVAVHYCHNF